MQNEDLKDIVELKEFAAGAKVEIGSLKRELEEVKNYGPRLAAVEKTQATQQVLLAQIDDLKKWVIRGVVSSVSSILVMVIGGTILWFLTS